MVEHRGGVIISLPVRDVRLVVTKLWALVESLVQIVENFFVVREDRFNCHIVGCGYYVPSVQT